MLEKKKKKKRMQDPKIRNSIYKERNAKVHRKKAKYKPQGRDGTPCYHSRLNRCGEGVNIEPRGVKRVQKHRQVGRLGDNASIKLNTLQCDLLSQAWENVLSVIAWGD